MTFLYSSNVGISNTSANPVVTSFANTIQLDALSRLKISTVQDQTWYSPGVDKDGDLRYVERFTSNVITVTATANRTNTNAIAVSSTVNINPGAVIEDGGGVPYSPPTYVVRIPSSGNLILNQNVTVTSTSNLTVNNNRAIATATGNQTTGNLTVSSTVGFAPMDLVLNTTPGSANTLPFNTFVVAVAGPNNIILNQNVTVANGDTIAADTANSYFNILTSDITLNPGQRADGSVTRQSRITHKVQPGVSHTVYQTVNFNGNDSNTIKAFGLFDDDAGLYWQINGTINSLSVVVRRTLADGSIYEDKVSRANFNVDKLDGTGPSTLNFTTSSTVAMTGWNRTTANPNLVGGYLVDYAVTPGQGNTFGVGTNLTVGNVSPSTFNGTFSVAGSGTSNVTIAYPTNPGTFSSMTNGTLYQSQYHKYYTWWIEFVGGRTGRIRFGLGSPVGPAVVHQFNYSGQLSTTFVTANALPMRWQISNVGQPNATTSMSIAGNTFNIEAGGSLNPGFGVSAFTTGWLADSSLSPIIGFGLRAAAPYNSADLQLKSFTMLDTANRIVGGGGGGTLYGAFYWQLILNPSITGPIPVPVNAGKASRYWQYQPGANIVANTGILVDSGFFTSQIAQSNETITNFLNMGKDVLGYNPDQLVLCVQQLAAGTNQGNIVATMNWVELL
jgi:hypothetical protein